ncbi:MAG: hypothetical protein Q9169_006954 [Polycauliona sp. 2 TL-2023]
MAAPEIAIRLSFSPATYHYSEPTAPELSLTVTSNAKDPLTIFTWPNILNPHLALLQRRFIITDLTTGLEVPQSTIAIRRAPFKRVRGSGDEKYFLTVEPGVATSVSCSSGSQNPLPKGSDGRKIHDAVGVDGLEPGHRYRLTVAEENPRVWWHWGTKDDILVHKHDVGSRSLSTLKPEKKMLRFAPIEGIEFCVEE